MVRPARTAGELSRGCAGFKHPLTGCREGGSVDLSLGRKAVTRGDYHDKRRQKGQIRPR
nr:MAG TPA: hypothetical protein [Caudoviricetes sp.]